MDDKDSAILQDEETSIIPSSTSIRQVSIKQFEYQKN
jgi:hypothetical protein